MNKNYDYVMQQNNTDCGIACIMTILMYYGIKPSREKLIEKLPKKRDGYTAYDLIKLSKEFGINSYGVKEKIENVTKLPAIAHTIKNNNMFHFIVILEKNSKKRLLRIMDPAEGIKTISYDEFSEITTNIFLIFNGKKKKITKDIRFKNQIKKIVLYNRKLIAKTLILSLIYMSLALLFNYYLKTILTYNNNLNILLIILFIFLNISILKNLIDYQKNKLILNLSINIDKDITKKVINHILNLPYKYFITKPTGELITIIEDIENFKEIVTKTFVLCAVDSILVFVILLYTMFLNIYITIILVVTIIVVFLVTKKYQYIFNDEFIKCKLTKIDYTSNLINYLTSYETIKNLNISEKVSKKLLKKFSISLNHDKKYSQKFYNYNFINSFISDFSYVIFIFITAIIALRSNIEIFDIVLFSSIFSLIMSFLGSITENLSLYKVYATSTDRVLDCLDIKQEQMIKTNFTNIKTIVYKDVTYQKDNNLPLKDINLKIIKGDKIYISGPSGSGKSTMMKLLLRYVEVTKGNILIDNIKLKNINLSFLRENITYIGQNEELFSGTIKENLDIVDKTKKNQQEASKITLLDKFLENNSTDYNFNIEEGGANLSGGEKKKIILTRGLLHFKNVLILDEVFNEMSISEERQILTSLFKKYENKIIIMISHRNSNEDLFNKKIKLKGDGSLNEIN